MQIVATETAAIPNLLRRLIARVFFDQAAFSRAYLSALKTEVERKNG